MSTRTTPRRRRLAGGGRRTPSPGGRRFVTSARSLVVMPAQTASPATFDLADLHIETAVASR